MTMETKRTFPSESSKSTQSQWNPSSVIRSLSRNVKKCPKVSSFNGPNPTLKLSICRRTPLSTRRSHDGWLCAPYVVSKGDSNPSVPSNEATTCNAFLSSHNFRSPRSRLRKSGRPRYRFPDLHGWVHGSSLWSEPGLAATLESSPWVKSNKQSVVEKCVRSAKSWACRASNASTQ